MRLAVSALLFLPATVAAADLAPAVPSQFIGEWNARLGDCGTTENGSALRLGRDQIQYGRSAASCAP